MLYKALLDASDGCYEFVDTYEFRLHSLEKHYYKFIFRIVPHKRCLERMIHKNYYSENKALGPSMDFELGFQGYNSPYKARID
mgnify:CR=1 FL=1